MNRVPTDEYFKLLEASAKTGSVVYVRIIDEDFVSHIALSFKGHYYLKEES